ncbi:hypothetical protein [Pseudaeromonas paramecii]|uniref:Glycosyltransferase n=1 Tax=Pseudaeromonas paramecii TaxID=2138166 RepID=A0ABP8Q260_9GAMM
MTKIAYVYKQKGTDAAWSSVIAELGVYLCEQDARIRTFRLDNSHRQSLQASRQALVDYDLSTGDILLINHAICFWLLLPLLLRLRRRGVRLVFLFHEHEHILGLGYCLRHLGEIRVKEWLRHIKLWYRIPSWLSEQMVCLSSYQAVVLGRLAFERLSYLGVDVGRFPVCERQQLVNGVGGNAVVLFAHDPARFDKGGRFCSVVSQDPRFSLVYGRDRILPYAEVYKKYHDVDIVFLPSDSESFSLVLAEALATNRCVVTNANVGIVQLLLSSYTVDELASRGLFVCAHSMDGYRDGLERAAAYILSDEVKTHELFSALRLDLPTAFERLNLFIKRIGG